MGHVLFLRLTDIAKDGSDGVEQQRNVFFRETRGFFALCAEMAADVLAADPLAERIVSCAERVQSVHVGQLFPQPRILFFGDVHQDLLRLDLRDLRQQHLPAVFAGQLQRVELSGGDIAPGKTEPVAVFV